LFPTLRRRSREGEEKTFVLCIFFIPSFTHFFAAQRIILTRLLFQNMNKLGKFDELDIFVDGDENKSRLVKQLSGLSVEDGSESGEEEMVRHRTTQR